LNDEHFYHKDPSMQLSHDNRKDFMSIIKDEGAKAIVDRRFVVSDLDWLPQISNCKHHHIDMVR
jgi:hypothetical protein